MADIYSIFNRCQYRNCPNGRYNGSRLFYFPKDDQRRMKWIECTGNDRIRSWKSTTMRKACICYKHFRKEDIEIDDYNMRLKKNVIPIHWKELESTKKEVEQQAQHMVEETVTETMETADAQE